MDVKQAVRQAGLGEILERYRQSIVAELSSAIGFLLSGALWLYVGQGLIRALGVMFLVFGLIAAAVAWIKSRRHLFLCTGGLVTTDSRVLTTDDPVVTNAVAWDDVEYMRVWVPRLSDRGTTDDQQRRCVLHLRDGRRLNLARPPYAHAKQLTHRIEQQVGKLAYPRRTAELRQTGATEFGPITVTTNGIHYRGHLAEWQEITRMRRNRVRLRVWSATAQQPIISRQLRTIPDVAVLMRIVAERAENVGIRG